MRREKKVLILEDSKGAIAAVRKAGRTGNARSRHLRVGVNMVVEVKEGGGEVKLGWVKAHMGILGNETDNVVAKNAVEKRESVEEGEEGVMKRAMGWEKNAATHYCRLRGGKGIGWWW